MICFYQTIKSIHKNLEDKPRHLRSKGKKFRSEEIKSNENFGIKYQNKSKSSKINETQSIEPCKINKEGILGKSYSEFNGTKLPFTSSKEKLWKLRYEHDYGRNKTLEEKFPRGNYFSKRDVQGKDNDPWSIISPVGKYKNI